MLVKEKPAAAAAAAGSRVGTQVSVSLPPHCTTPKQLRKESSPLQIIEELKAEMAQAEAQRDADRWIDAYMGYLEMWPHAFAEAMLLRLEVSP